MTLIEAVRPLLEQTADRAVARMVAEARSYRDHSVEELRPVAVRKPGGEPRRRGRPEQVAPNQIELFREAGRTRALQGVSVDDMLHGWRIGLDELRATARQQAAGSGSATPSCWRSPIAASPGPTRGCSSRPPSTAAPSSTSCAASSTSAPTSSARSCSGRRRPASSAMQALAFGLDLGELYVPFRVSVPSGLDVRAAERQLGVADSAGPRRGLAALIDGDLAGFSCRLPDPARRLRGRARTRRRHSMRSRIRTRSPPERSTPR